jgi:hypothetical protein
MRLVSGVNGERIFVRYRDDALAVTEQLRG